MRKMNQLIIALMLGLTTACTYVQPNYVGVLQENYGRNGKSDFTLVKGKVSTTGAGIELFQVPLFEQGGEFSEALTLKAADNTEFYSRPVYSYTVIENRAIDIVFNNKHLGSGDAFLDAVEDNTLEKRIKDIIREESRMYTTDTLMANSGSLKFEKRVEAKVREAFLTAGFTLTSFTSQLDFPKGVKAKIEERNNVNQDVAVVQQQIDVQLQKNKLAALKALEREINNKGLTDPYLRNKAIDGWVSRGCPMPQSLGQGQTMFGIFAK